MTSSSVVWEWLATSSVKPTQFFCKSPLLPVLPWHSYVRNLDWSMHTLFSARGSSLHRESLLLSLLLCFQGRPLVDLVMNLCSDKSC